MELFFKIILLSNLFLLNSYSDSLQNEKVTTYIDASSQLVKINNEITVVNKQKEPIDSYLFIVDPQWITNVSYIEAVDEKGYSLNVNKVYDKDDSWLKFEIFFRHSLPSGQILTFKVFSVIINYLQSYPKSVNQNEKHLVIFGFNVYYFSHYLTYKLTSYVYLGTAHVISVDGAMYKIADDGKYGFKYGPYNSLDPMSEYPSIIHYENTSPFLAVQSLNRYIRISHWGYLSVWDEILLEHTGPKFKEPYERTFEKSPPDTRIESFVTTLPDDAIDIYLKDDIGLILSFNVDDSKPFKTKVTIKPRFVLYGGWKTKYEIGYSLPIINYLNYDDNESTFVLSIPLIDNVFPNMVIKQAEINIILPEGATYQDIHPYFDLENNTGNQYCYVFDIICREVVSFKRHNLVEHHATKFLLTYTFHQLILLIKPLQIILFIFTMYLMFVIYKLGTSKSDTPSGTCQNTRAQISQSIPKVSRPKTEVKVDRQESKGKNKKS